MTPDLSSDQRNIAEMPLAAASWMAQRWGFALPPIPSSYGPTLTEFETEALFGTSQKLATLISRERLFAVLAAGQWPEVGLAFGFQIYGRSGYWRYVLVGGKAIITVDLRILIDDDARLSSGLALISRANFAIERFLSRDINFARMTAPDAHDDEAPRRIVSYSNATGIDRETVSTWTVTAGLNSEHDWPDVFLPPRPSNAQVEPEMIFRV
jgi:hypothetical protein